ncbi:hypothetical protein [Azospirillum sp. ST 5-10]|uniref:hypothetical protein n=1 Tax=unclassified Azospirillum TaxID=2630922 RepID=UPI003F4A3BEF
MRRLPPFGRVARTEAAITTVARLLLSKNLDNNTLTMRVALPNGGEFGGGIQAYIELCLDYVTGIALPCSIYLSPSRLRPGHAPAVANRRGASTGPTSLLDRFDSDDRRRRSQQERIFGFF